jgi:hypothetical protein
MLQRRTGLSDGRGGPRPYSGLVWLMGESYSWLCGFLLKLSRSPCSVLRAPCSVLRAPCSVLRAPCSVLRAPVIRPDRGAEGPRPCKGLGCP